MSSVATEDAARQVKGATPGPHLYLMPSSSKCLRMVALVLCSSYLNSHMNLHHLRGTVQQQTVYWVLAPAI